MLPYTPIEDWGWTFLLSVHQANRLSDIPSAQGAFRLLWFVSGEATLVCNGTPLEVEAPSLLCQGSQMAMGEVSPGAEIRAVVFHPGVLNDGFLTHDPYDGSRLQGSILNDHYYLHPFLNQGGALPGPHPLPLATVDRLQALFGRMENEIHSRADDFWPCRTRSLLLEALILTREGFGPSHQNDWIDRVVMHLHTHYDQTISLPELARQFATNRTTLNQRFREHTGKTIGDYVRSLRVQVAQVLLRDTTLPVLEIVERAGFADPSHFGRLFRSVTGTNPSEYRSQHNWLLRKST